MCMMLSGADAHNQGGADDRGLRGRVQEDVRAREQRAVRAIDEGEHPEASLASGVRRDAARRHQDACDRNPDGGSGIGRASRYLRSLAHPHARFVLPTLEAGWRIAAETSARLIGRRMARAVLQLSVHTSRLGSHRLWRGGWSRRRLVAGRHCGLKVFRSRRAPPRKPGLAATPSHVLRLTRPEARSEHLASRSRKTTDSRIDS